MNIQQVRNATIIVEYGGKKILVDPMLERKAACLLSPLVETQHLRTHFMNYLSCRRDAKRCGCGVAYTSTR